LIVDLRRLMNRWRAEDAAVADAALIANLGRARTLCSVVGALNAVHAIAFLIYWSSTTSGDVAHRWALALMLLHTGMGLLMAGGAVLAYKWRFALRSPWTAWFPLCLIAAGMLFSVAVVTVDQLVTPNITPYLIGSMICSLAIYLRPVQAAWVYALAFVAFWYGVGLTQENTAQLLSNRLNGIAAAVLGWAFSVVIWRKFATITLQHEQLGRANAELQEKQRDLERLTRLDGLTGLFNRTTFVELSRKELERAQRQGSDTAILILDLDHFKRINDTWGHPAGDAVLRHVAIAATGAVRSTDLVGRLGGEEFIVLLPATSIEAARKLAEKLRARLQASPAPWLASPIPVTASIGLAATTAAEKLDFETLYNAADKALYLAKTRGRNRVEP
jgi:diguanylate cyclase (GGDEF)-like protein